MNTFLLNPNYSPKCIKDEIINLDKYSLKIIKVFYTSRQGDGESIPMYMFMDNSVTYCEPFDKKFK
jgi:hypothetical protein